MVKLINNFLVKFQAGIREVDVNHQRDFIEASKCLSGVLQIGRRTIDQLGAQQPNGGLDCLILGSIEGAPNPSQIPFRMRPEHQNAEDNASY